MTSRRPMKFSLSTDSECRHFNEVIAGMRLQGKRPVVELLPEKRSLDQNALSFALYKEISAQREDQSLMDVRCQCKLDYGIPLLCRDDPEFAELWHQIEAATTYEQRLFLMKKYKVTSEMKKPTFSEYIDTVVREYAKQGVVIDMPGDDW